MKKTIISGFLLLLLTGPTIGLAASEDGGQYHSNGMVGFKSAEDITDPVDPTHPAVPVDPIDPTVPGGNPELGQRGPLSIDFASSLSFGVNRISNEDQTYYAEVQHYGKGQSDTPDYVQISDNRGTAAGWTLTVKQNGQFKANDQAEYPELTGAEVSLSEPHLNSTAHDIGSPHSNKTIKLQPDGSELVVMYALKNEGAGTWEDYWGNITTIKQEKPDGSFSERKVTKAVQLFVPGETPKSATTYSTVFVWNLKDIPKN